MSKDTRTIQDAMGQAAGYVSRHRKMNEMNTRTKEYTGWWMMLLPCMLCFMLQPLLAGGRVVDYVNTRSGYRLLL